MRRILKEIPELVTILRKEKARERDFVVKQIAMMVQGTDQPGRITIELESGGDTPRDRKFGIQSQAHSQVAEKADIPGRYYKRMLGGDEADRGLLAKNLNHWFRKDGSKRRLVRCVDQEIRAFLSDRYRPISHLDLLTTAVQVMTGQYTETAGKPWAKGARAFSWHLSPTRLDVSLVNPCIWVNMDDERPKVGTIDPGTDFGGTPDSWHTWMKTNQPGGVFPACRIRNSETGHGGLTIEGGLYEAVCDNSAHIGLSLSKIHLGKQLQEGLLQDVWSTETLKKQNQLIFAQTADIIRGVFEPEQLQKHVLMFKGLESVAVPNVTIAAGRIAELPGMTEEVRDEILAFYNASTEARGNLHDFTRAVTGAAHAFREIKPEVASELETLGGEFIKGGERRLAALKA